MKAYPDRCVCACCDLCLFIRVGVLFPSVQLPSLPRWGLLAAQLPAQPACHTVLLLPCLS